MTLSMTIAGSERIINDFLKNEKPKGLATCNKVTKMKTFIIEEMFVGYADITIEAETEEEAIALYNRGHYPDSQYDMDDMFYVFEFQQISEIYEKETEPVNYYQGA